MDKPKNLQEFLDHFETTPPSGWGKSPSGYTTRPRLLCADGTHLSIQASSFHYSIPARDNDSNYTHVEIGYPSKVIDEILPYAEDQETPLDTVYGRVPVGLVEEVVSKRGGAVGIMYKWNQVPPKK